LASGRLTQTADFAVRLLTRTRVEASPTVGRWPADGSVPLASRSSAEFSGGSQQEPVLLLRGKRLVIHPSAAGWRCVILGG
jgi:hypothetical protein